jgi:predicted DNA-binding transcriptional regulator AlpA
MSTTHQESSKQNVPHDPVFSKSEMAEYIGVSVPTANRLEAAGDAPTRTRLSQGRWGYRKSHCNAWLDARAETTEAA